MVHLSTQRSLELPSTLGTLGEVGMYNCLDWGLLAHLWGPGMYPSARSASGCDVSSARTGWDWVLQQGDHPSSFEAWTPPVQHLWPHSSCQVQHLLFFCFQEESLTTQGCVAGGNLDHTGEQPPLPG